MISLLKRAAVVLRVRPGQLRQSSPPIGSGSESPRCRAAARCRHDVPQRVCHPGIGFRRLTEWSNWKRGQGALRKLDVSHSIPQTTHASRSNFQVRSQVEPHIRRLAKAQMAWLCSAMRSGFSRSGLSLRGIGLGTSRCRLTPRLEGWISCLRKPPPLFRSADKAFPALQKTL